MDVQTRVPESDIALDPATLHRRQRLYRALTDPDTLDEFLVNPEAVAERFEVALTESELTAVRNIGHFASEWDLLCGGGRWTDALAATARRPAGGLAATPIEDVLSRTVRARIAVDILQDVPAAIRYVTEACGSAGLVGPGQDPDTVPPSVRPLVRALRTVARNINREIEHELAELSLHGMLARLAPPHAVQGSHPPDGAAERTPPPASDPQQQLVPVLGRYLRGVIDRAIEHAFERMPPVAPDRRVPAPAPPGAERTVR